GAAVGLATGGAGLIGRATLGAAASKMAASEGLKDAAAGTGFSGMASRMALRTADATSKSTFDFRNTTAGKKFASEVGLTTDNGVLKSVGLSATSGTGGFIGQRDRRAQKEVEFAKK